MHPYEYHALRSSNHMQVEISDHNQHGDLWALRTLTY